LEPAYEEALGRELETENISYEPQVELKIVYKGKPLNQTY
jgi:hypothetical protein